MYRRNCAGQAMVNAVVGVERQYSLEFLGSWRFCAAGVGVFLKKYACFCFCLRVRSIRIHVRHIHTWVARNDPRMRAGRISAIMHFFVRDSLFILLSWYVERLALRCVVLFGSWGGCVEREVGLKYKHCETNMLC